MKHQLHRFIEKITHYNQLVSDYKRAAAAAPDHALAHVNWGIDLAQAGRMEDALQKFEQAALLAPQRWEVFTNWGVALARTERLDEAVEKFQQAISLSPKVPSNYVLWGAVLMEMGETEEATQKYQKAIELAPESPEPYVNWGVALAKRGDYFAALRHLKMATQIHAYQPNVYFLWGAILAELEDYEGAIEKFRITLRFIPGHVDSYYFWSVALNRTGRYEQALEKSKRALQFLLERDQERPEVYLNQGDILANLQRYDVAIANYQHAAKLNPELAEAYLSWGIALCKQEEYEEGFVQLHKAEELDANAKGLKPAMGQFLLENNRPKEALKYLETAYQEAPTQVDVTLNYAMALIKTGQSEKALEQLQKLESLDKWNPQVHYLLGTHYMGVGEFEQARQHLNRAIIEKPEFEDAAVNLSLVLCELGDTTEALRCLRPLLRKYPDSARINFFYGTVLYHSGDYKEAIIKFNRAMHLDPHDPKPVIGLGELYVKEKLYEKAEGLLKQALTQQPASVPALFLLGISLTRQATQNIAKAAEAQSAFDTVVEKAPNHLEAICHRAAIQSQIHSIEHMHRAYEQALEKFTDNQSQACIWMTWAMSLECIHREEWQIPEIVPMEPEHRIELLAELKDMSLGLQKRARQVFPEVDAYLVKNWI